MTKTTILKQIEIFLKPIYDESCEREIEYFSNKNAEYKELREKLNGLRPEIGQESSSEYKELYIYLFGRYNKETRRQEVGGVFSGIPKSKHDYLTLDIEKVKHKITKQYNDSLKSMLEKITTMIEKENPSKIEEGHSGHDFSFILTVNGVRRSFTINTIIAEGFVQTAHLRTLVKLHKGVVA